MQDPEVKKAKRREYLAKNKDKINARRRLYNATYNVENKEKLKEYKKEWQLNNKELIKSKRRQYYLDNSEEIKQKVKEYAKNNKDKIKAARKKYVSENREVLNRKKKEYWAKFPEKRKAILDRSFDKYPINKIKGNLRNRLYYALKGCGWSKSSKTETILGCSYQEVMEHIEIQFMPGMSWDNYGQWHIDHILPLSYADNAEECEMLCHYINLQPLWAEDNLMKHNKIGTIFAI